MNCTTSCLFSTFRSICLYFSRTHQTNQNSDRYTLYYYDSPVFKQVHLTPSPASSTPMNPDLPSTCASFQMMAENANVDNATDNVYCNLEL